MKKATTIILLAVLTACSKPETHHLDYRQLAIEQNELIIYQEEKIEELATVIQATHPAYRTDYTAIDSLNYILDSLYTH